MSELRSSCPHISIIGNCTKEDIIERRKSVCDVCGIPGPNLFICLYQDCLCIGCGDSALNHSIKHFQRQKDHCLILNLTSLHVYCLLCKCEVFLENNDPPLPGMLTVQPAVAKTDSDSDDDLNSFDDCLKPKGLTGLQNMGNTCYMNSALQALSNCPPLTNFFLECGSFIRSEKKPGLAVNFMHLIKEVWHKKRPSYVVPSGIAVNFRLAFPTFRGYNQQDAQEFLRCFMDQLHEELKEPVLEFPGVSASPDSHDEFDGTRSDSGIPVSEESSQSDADYETCESGTTSEKDSSLCSSDEAIDPSEPSQESSDLLTPSCISPTVPSEKHSRNITSNKIHSFEKCTSEPTDLQDEKHKMNGIPPFCNSNHLSSDSVLSNETSVSGGNDNHMHLNECKSNCTESTNNLNSTSVHQVCHQSHGKECILYQASQLKDVASQAVINSVHPTWRKKPVQYRSIISDIFDGKILSSVQCLTCDNISYTKETFQDLSLPIPSRDHLHMIHASQGSHQKSGGTCTDVYSHQGWFNSLFGWMLSWFWGPSVSLQDCLAAFFSADELKGDNMYSCEKCSKLRNGIKYSKVIELPEVLCIHLKRFRHELMYSSKINSHVSFPLEGLDMSPFIHKSYVYGVTTYDLASVICHHGTAGSGHYTAYSLNYFNDQWYEFDDQYVTSVDAEMVRNCEAYVLFYKKSSEEMYKRRQCAVELLSRSKLEHGLLKFHISKQWINKFNNFAEPGPITNTDFLCIHGGVPPQKANIASELCTVLPQAVWEYLHDTFGGGPPCTHLYVCPVCQAELDKLNLRRKKELDDFISMNIEFRKMENLTTVYALSMNWFKTWENFVCKDEVIDFLDCPGPIDNNPICHIKNNQPVLRLGSDYCSVSQEMYEYLASIYGGGPTITLQPNAISATSGLQIASGNSATLPRNAALPPCYSQTVPVHSVSKSNASSHSQPSCYTSRIPCDTEMNISSAKLNECPNSAEKPKSEDV